MIRRKMLGFLLLSLGTAVFSILHLTSHAQIFDRTFIVNRTGDESDHNIGDGVCDTRLLRPGHQCTLRAAIEEFNALGPSSVLDYHIEFNIAGAGSFTIAPTSPLPQIVVPITLDGETQPGASCPTENDAANLRLFLDGSHAGLSAHGFKLGLGSDGSTIRGLAIGNFRDHGIVLQSDNNKVACNHIGIGLDGVSDVGNSWGVSVVGNNNRVGGINGPGQRNVISGNLDGIRIVGSDNVVQGNYIGTTANGMSSVSNSGGIYIGGQNNLIGGVGLLAPNIISGNTGYGVRINGGNDNLLYQNSIGVAANGVTPLPNSTNGVEIVGHSAGNNVGGTTQNQGNIMAHNLSDGVSVRGNITGIPEQNSIIGNSIYDNGDLGIDLGVDGVNQNDSGDGDEGENGLQNYPTLTASSTTFIVNVALDGLPNSTYSLDFYRSDSCDSSGFGEGQFPLAMMQAVIVQTDNNGVLSIPLNTQSVASLGDYITATATDSNGNTSEFSACLLLEEGSATTPSPTPTSTVLPPTNTPAPSQTAAPTASSTPTLPSGVTPSATPTATATSTPTVEPSSTPTASLTPIFPLTPTLTSTPDPLQTDSFFIYLPVILEE